MAVKAQLIGDWIKGATGYSAHLRGLSKALYALNPDTAVDCPRPHLWERMVDETELRLLTNSFPRGHKILVTTPDHALIRMCERHESLNQYCVFEGDRIPAFWARILSNPKINRVLVPSSNVEKALLGTPGFNSPSKVRIVPHGINESVFKPLDRAAVLEKSEWSQFPRDKFVFGFVGGWAQGENDRKDLATALRAYCSAFRPEDPVLFLVKINSVYNPGMDFNAVIDALGLPKERPPITIVPNDLGERQLAEAYNLMDVHSCITRGEAFGMTFLEAMACGAVNICPSWGGQASFCNGDNSVMVDGEMRPATDGNRLYEGIRWNFTPVESVSRAMRLLYEDRKLLKRYRDEGIEEAKKWTWNSSAKILLKALE